jgi:uncharacterized protein YndB with AHSA1/START domain
MRWNGTWRRWTTTTLMRDLEGRNGGGDGMTDITGMYGKDYGRLDRRDGRLVLEFTRRLQHPPQKVWRALTEPDHLAAWFPSTIEGDRATGARLHFGFREMEAAPFDGEMLIFEPPSVMELRWGDEILRFEVRPDGDGSVLSFRNIFDELGKAARDGAGWHSCLDLLGCEVGGEKAPWSAADRWRELRDAYRERFGPDASTIGPPEE